MEVPCDICLANFNLDHRRPKTLPCGHTVCKECVENPALGNKCPSCRKDLGDNTPNFPDNISLIRLIDHNDAAPPCKKPRLEDSAVQQMQRGLDVGKKLSARLQQMIVDVPLAAKRALKALKDTTETQSRQIEETLKQQQELAGNEGPDEGALAVITEKLQLAVQLAVQLEGNFCLLNNMDSIDSQYSVVAEEEDGATWRASVQPLGSGDLLRLLLLQLQTDGNLEKADDIIVPTPAVYVGPPMSSTLTISDNDLDGDSLKVNDILKDRARWRDTRIIRGLKGKGSELLLSLLAPQLEELEILALTPRVADEVHKMSNLKRLDVTYTYNEDSNQLPVLPLQLEELRMDFPGESQLLCVTRMPRLRSLSVSNYSGPNVTLSHSRHGALRWLCVNLSTFRKATMLNLVRSYASTLQELRVVCSASDEGAGGNWFFPDLGEDLRASNLRVLRRLVLERRNESLCTNQVGACLKQREALRSIFPSVDVFCRMCNVSEV